MKGKLYKSNDGTYILVDPTKGVYDKGYLIGTSRESDVSRLSLKNCQEIERGYDLDELANLYSTMTVFIKKDEIPTEKQIEDAEYISEIAFKEGFHKALEILGDKKFSEEDIKKAYTTGWNSCNNFTGYDEYQDFIELPDFIQLLQQTEWDVEIEMENVGRVKIGIGSKTEQLIPKRDADGCLILKKI